MKQLLVILVATFLYTQTNAQTLTKYLTDAKTAYAVGNLNDAHFALQQSLHELDVTVGKSILALLPSTINNLTNDTTKNSVNAGGGFLGTIVSKHYGNDTKYADVEIITNSPTIAAINSYFTNPMLAAMSGNSGKIVKIQSYKARISKENDAEYKLEIPLNNTLVTLKINPSTETNLQNAAATLPLAAIAKLVD